MQYKICSSSQPLCPSHLTWGSGMLAARGGRGGRGRGPEGGSGRGGCASSKASVSERLMLV
ncbi:hypothetical protein RJZ90_001280 [Blastomyces dermatitidis]